MKLTGADIIVECLLEQGVDTVFGYPGGAILNVYDKKKKKSDKIHHYLRPIWSPASPRPIWTVFPWSPSPAM